MCKTQARIGYIEENILPQIHDEITDNLDHTFIKMCIYAAELLKKTPILKYVKYNLYIGAEHCKNYEKDYTEIKDFCNQLMFIIASAIEYSEKEDQKEDLRAIKYHCEIRIHFFEAVHGNNNNIKEAWNLMYKHLCDRKKFKYETDLTSKNKEIQQKADSLETNVPTNIAKSILNNSKSTITTDAGLIALTIRRFKNYTNHEEIESKVLDMNLINQKIRNEIFNNVSKDAKAALKKAKAALKKANDALKKNKDANIISSFAKTAVEAATNAIGYATDAMEVVIEEVSLINKAADAATKKAKNADAATKKPKAVNTHTRIIATIFKEATDIFTNAMKNIDTENEDTENEDTENEANVASIFTEAAEKITDALENGFNLFDDKTRKCLVKTAINFTTMEIINNSELQIENLVKTAIKKK